MSEKTAIENDERATEAELQTEVLGPNADMAADVKGTAAARLLALPRRSSVPARA